MTSIPFYTMRNACIKAQQDADEIKERVGVIKRGHHTHNADGTEIFEVLPVAAVWLQDDDDIVHSFDPREAETD